MMECLSDCVPRLVVGGAGAEGAVPGVPGDPGMYEPGTNDGPWAWQPHVKFPWQSHGSWQSGGSLIHSPQYVSPHPQLGNVSQPSGLNSHAKKPHGPTWQGPQLEPHGPQLEPHGPQLEPHGPQLARHGAQLAPHGPQLGPHSSHVSHVPPQAGRPTRKSRTGCWHTGAWHSPRHVAPPQATLLWHSSQGARCQPCRQVHG